VCCPEDMSSSDIILISILNLRHGMLKWMRSVVFPKGASLRGTVVYVARINRQGHLRMAKPCLRCADRLRDEGVKRVIFSTEEGWDYINY